MAYRTLDLTLISAKDLKDVNLIGKMDVYAEVSVSGDPRSKQRTKIHVDSGPNPTWNQTLRFNVPADAGASGTLEVVLRAEKKALGDKDLGVVHVPIKELLENVKGDGPTESQFVSYQVRTPNSGKSKGVINLSYKLSERITAPAAATYTTIPTAGAAYPPPAAGAPYPPQGGYGYPATSEKGPKTDEPVTAYPPPAGYPAPAASEKSGKSEKPEKSSEPVTAYPAGSSSAAGHPPPQPYYGAPQYGAPPPQYGAPAPQYGYAPPPQYGYAPPPQYGYAPPPQPGYGYQGQGYGYPPAQQYAEPQKQKKSGGGMGGGLGLGLGAGLLGGAIGGMILGDMVSDAAEDSYDAGYDDGFDAGGDF